MCLLIYLHEPLAVAFLGFFHCFLAFTSLFPHDNPICGGKGYGIIVAPANSEKLKKNCVKKLKIVGWVNFGKSCNIADIWICQCVLSQHNQ